MEISKKTKIVGCICIVLAFSMLFTNWIAVSGETKEAWDWIGSDMTGYLEYGMGIADMFSNDENSERILKYTRRIKDAVENGKLTPAEGVSVLTGYLNIPGIDDVDEEGTLQTFGSFYIMVFIFTVTLILIVMFLRFKGCYSFVEYFCFGSVIILAIMMASISSFLKQEMDMSVSVTLWMFISIVLVMPLPMIVKVFPSLTLSAEEANEAPAKQSENKSRPTIIKSVPKKEPATHWVCKGCGRANELMANFCSACGQKRPERPKCPSCGKEIMDATAAFCNNCGFGIGNELTYNKALEEMQFADQVNSSEKYIGAANLFKSVLTYKDAEDLEKQCREKAKAAQNDEIYNRACQMMASDFLIGKEEAIKRFSEIIDWKDSAQKIEQCKDIIREKQEKAEKERIELERKKEEERIKKAEEEAAAERKKQLEYEEKRMKRQQQSKKTGKIILLLTPAICLILAFVLILTLFVIPMRKYNDAVMLEKFGYYEEAFDIFEDLGDFKDSQEHMLDLMEHVDLTDVNLSDESVSMGEVQIETVAEEFPAEIGSETPEEAILGFLTAFSNADFERALQYCSAQSYADRYSFEESVSRLGLFRTDEMMPTEYDEYKQFMVRNKKGSFSGNLMYFAVGLLLPEETETIRDGESCAVDDPNWYQRFFKKIDPDRLSGIEILSIDENSPSLQENSMGETGRAHFFSDKTVERMVLLSFDDCLYAKGFNLSEYDGKWYISALRSYLDENTLGMATPVDTKNEYIELISDDSGYNNTMSGTEIDESLLSINIESNTADTDWKNNTIEIGSDTPEEAVRGFFNSLKSDTLQNAFQYCAVNVYAERFSAEKMISRRNYYNLSNVTYDIPSEYEAYKPLLAFRRKIEYSKSLHSLVYSLLIPDTEEMDNYNVLSYGKDIVISDPDWCQEFAEIVDPEQLKSLKILRIDENNIESQRQMEEHNAWAYLFADESVERTALLEVNGNLYMKGITLSKYDGKWYVSNLYAISADEPALGYATMVESEAEYLEIINPTISENEEAAGPIE